MIRILENIQFQKTLKHIADVQGTSMEHVEEKATKYLKELYTVHHPMMEALAMEAGQYFISRAYDKTIDVNPKEMKQLVKLMYRHPVAFVMTHKTYIDMLVLAIVLARHGLPLPYTFAGINMSFLGLGQLGRQAGVIFIRRSFKDNQIYKATLRHYLASLVNDGGHFMWAIEGTRSRTGKLLWPKMGILKYILEAGNHTGMEVKYVPVSIVYDLIPDVKEMTKEMRGKDKKPESLSWGINYIRKMRDNLGKISLRLGAPVNPDNTDDIPTPEVLYGLDGPSDTLSRFALNLVYRINNVTPVTTTSLVCIALLSKYSLQKRAIESDVVDLMQLIESQKSDALVDRGTAIGESVQVALNLLNKANIVKQLGDSVDAKYIINDQNYLSATYYANMAVHHLYHRAFIEMGMIEVNEIQPSYRLIGFWNFMMELRDLFKFEFFYSDKATFSDEIESNLDLMAEGWESRLKDKSPALNNLLSEQNVLVAPVILHTYIEAYRVVIQGLLTWEIGRPFDEKYFLVHCQYLGGEMQWQGKIQRTESISPPFLINGLRLVKNQDLLPTKTDLKEERLKAFLFKLDQLADIISALKEITLKKNKNSFQLVPIDRAIVPGSRTESITNEILEGESGPHIGAFFDLDRTLIKGFSAKEFFQSRLLSGKMTTKEIVAQFAGVLVYAMGNKNFAGLAAISANGVKGVKEKVFIDVGEEVYLKHLASEIYPESRSLVAAHLAKGHTVAIISAATPYQVNPIARDLGIEHVLCSEMEVEKGIFTGNVIEPPCWGEGKAHAGRTLAEKCNLDLQKSFFYTDSAEDMPLLELVGYPRPLNPDGKLSVIAFENDWPVLRFDDEERSGIADMLRTGLAVGSFIPAIINGIATGSVNMSWKDGINSMMATIGDMGTSFAGIKVAIKGKEHLWSHRPAVFIFNHQSSADLLIAAKLVRKNAVGIAKKELQKVPILGQLMSAAGVIFLDRSDREKAIEALKPAVEALRQDTSIIIAPEGTRSYDYKLGEFKKGAFHIAMQAGVSIVPIIIKNAHDAMPRGTNVFRPSTIEVVVSKPIPTDDWDVKDLENHIAYIRNLYLEELGQVEVVQ